MSVQEKAFRSFTKNAENAPSLGIALPVRKKSPVDFWMCLYQMLPPLNTKIGYLIQKGDEKNVKEGKLPAAARNSLIERALESGMQYLFFLDDDVLFPDITLYRMWGMIRKRPDIAVITAVGGTKLTPSDPLIYQTGVQGSWWDWQLGALVPIESAWAGCMLVNLDYVKKMKEPWFNDVVFSDKSAGEDARVKQNVWGHDRYFHRSIKEQTGGLVVADTGLLVAHFDADLQKSYILAPDSPPFQKPILGESWIPFFDDEAQIAWRRIVLPDLPTPEFKGYLKWLETLAPKAGEEKISIIKEPEKQEKVEEKEGYTLVDKRSTSPEFEDWFKGVAA